MPSRLLEQAENALDRKDRRYQKELLRAYQASLKEVRAKIAMAYERYGTEGKLSLAQMTKYERLSKLEKEIALEIGKLTGKNAQTLKKGIGDIFAEAFYRTGFALEVAAQAKLGFGQLNRRAIDAAINNPLDRVGFLQRNRDNQQRLARQLREQLTQGIIQGKSYQDTARSIKERMDVGASNVVRIAQTENHRAMVQGRLEGFEQAESAGLETRRVWVATLDGRTRDRHQDMDGEYANEDGLFDMPSGADAEGPGLTGNPEDDINCRCTVRVEIVGYEPKLRRARGEGVIPYKTYGDWEKNRIG